jgi:hypothetical protein
VSENLTQVYTTQFTANLEMLLQQTTSKLRGRIMEGSHVGKQAVVVNQVSAVQFTAPKGRFAPLGRQDPTFTRRWVVPIDRELDPIMIDTFDKLKTIVNPESEYVSSVAAAAARTWDDTILSALIGTAKTGTDSPSTDEAWSTSYDVADTFGSGASDGLTLTKLIEGNRILRHAHSLEDDYNGAVKTLIIGSTQEADLLNQAQVQSAEFFGKVTVIDGSVSRLYGFDLVVSERLPYASSIRSTIGFVKSGGYLGMWKDMNISIDQRADLSGRPWQLYSMMSFGATRTQLGKVVKIKCADTVTGDTAGTGGP